jgi:hypothetical protein
VGPHRVWWTPEFRLKRDATGPATPQELFGEVLRAVNITMEYERSTTSATMKLTDDGVIVVCWLYWISMDRYRAATNIARRGTAAG